MKDIKLKTSETANGVCGTSRPKPVSAQYLHELSSTPIDFHMVFILTGWANFFVGTTVQFVPGTEISQITERPASQTAWAAIGRSKIIN